MAAETAAFAQALDHLVGAVGDEAEFVAGQGQLKREEHAREQDAHGHLEGVLGRGIHHEPGDERNDERRQAREREIEHKLRLALAARRASQRRAHAASSAWQDAPSYGIPGQSQQGSSRGP
jgi:hypothetical protein